MQYALDISGVNHWFPDRSHGRKYVLNDVNLKIAPGQIVAVVGPSGCGKSTLLRAVLGTHPPKEGVILARDKRITRPSPDIGIVFQNYSLFPDLRAEDLVADGPIMHQTTFLQRLTNSWRGHDFYRRFRDDARELLIKVGLEHALDKFPREMSGGMQQRVAIAQALVMKPKILLLDEPFGALDEATRESLQDMLLTLYQENIKAKKEGKEPPYTILIVTHELNEAIYVADRVVGLSQFHEHGKTKGATVVYDKPVPVYLPGNDVDFHSEDFVRMRSEIRHCVFDKENCGNKSGNVTFWTDCGKGRTDGVIAVKSTKEIRMDDYAERDRILANAKARGEDYDIFGEK